MTCKDQARRAVAIALRDAARQAQGMNLSFIASALGATALVVMREGESWDSLWQIAETTTDAEIIASLEDSEDAYSASRQIEQARKAGEN